MGWLFRKRIKLMPGLTLNLGKKGASVTLGKRGASVNIGPRGTHANVGIPGTGLSFRERLDTPSKRQPKPQAYTSLSSDSYTSSSSSSDSGEQISEQIILAPLGFAAGLFGGLYYFCIALEWWAFFAVVASICCGLAGILTTNGLFEFFCTIWPQNKQLHRGEMLAEAEAEDKYIEHDNDTLGVSPVRQGIQDMASISTDDDIDDFSISESETDRKIREYIAEKMSVALASAKDKKKASEDIQGFLSGEIATLSGEVFSATIGDIATHEFAESHKHDLPMMLRCCEAELRNMASTGAVAAPYYFVRAAILAKKQQNYELEVKICQLLVTAYRIYAAAHRENGVKPPLNIRAGSSYENIVKRLPVAKAKLKQLKAEAKQKKLEERR